MYAVDMMNNMVAAFTGEDNATEENDLGEFRTNRNFSFLEEKKSSPGVNVQFNGSKSENNKAQATRITAVQKFERKRPSSSTSNSRAFANDPNG